MYIYIHIYIHTYIYTHIYIHICTHHTASTAATSRYPRVEDKPPQTRQPHSNGVCSPLSLLLSVLLHSHDSFFFQTCLAEEKEAVLYLTLYPPLAVWYFFLVLFLVRVNPNPNSNGLCSLCITGLRQDERQALRAREGVRVRGRGAEPAPRPACWH